MLGIVMMPSWPNAYRIQARTQTSKHNIVSLTIRESAQATDEIESQLGALIRNVIIYFVSPHVCASERTYFSIVLQFCVGRALVSS
jgi:hypothetical protein